MVKGVAKKAVALLAAGVMLCLVAVAVASAGTALTIGLAEGPGRNPVVRPGESYVQTLTVTGGDAESDVTIEVLAYREDAESGIVTISPPGDPGPFCGNGLIEPAVRCVHILPGKTMTIQLRVSVPTDVGEGGRYAALRFSAPASGDGLVGVVSAIVLPFRFTIKGSRLIHSGKIGSLIINTLEPGKPVVGAIVLENIGNHHFGVRGDLRIIRAGKTIAEIPITSQSPIPGCTSKIPVTWVPEKDIRAGLYEAQVLIRLEDGSLLDRASTVFEIPPTYEPPGIPARTRIADGTNAPQYSMPLLLVVGGAALAVGCLATMRLTRRRRRYT